MGGGSEQNLCAHPMVGGGGRRVKEIVPSHFPKSLLPFCK